MVIFAVQVGVSLRGGLPVVEGRRYSFEKNGEFLAIFG